MSRTLPPGSEEEITRQLEYLRERAEELPERCRVDIEQHIDDYRNLILKMARKYVRNRVEIEDLVQEALIGLVLADRRFDPARSDNFHTYAVYRMKGRMFDYCISNETPIYVPTQVAKSASYVKQMRRLLEHEGLPDEAVLVDDIIATETHPAEEELSKPVRETLKELKRKLGRIAKNSKTTYERLTRLSLESLSQVVSDEVLEKVPSEAEHMDELVSSRELSQQLRESLGEKKFLVISLRSQGWTYDEIASHLCSLGYTNRAGEQVSRQAVKGIYDETMRAIREGRLFKSPGGGKE